jgi:hypothetical protein
VFTKEIYVTARLMERESLQWQMVLSTKESGSGIYRMVLENTKCLMVALMKEVSRQESRPGGENYSSKGECTKVNFKMISFMVKGY